MTVRKTTRKQLVVADTGKGSSKHAQVIGLEASCDLCGMPLLNAATFGRNSTTIRENSALELQRAQAVTVNGCMFCAPDNAYAVWVTDAALLRFTDAFGLTERVLAVREALSHVSNLQVDRSAAWKLLRESTATFTVATGKAATVKVSAADVRAKLLGS